MPDPLNSSNAALCAKAITLLPKILLAVVGAIFALVLSGDITLDGNLKINLRVVTTLAAAVSLSLSGGAFFIEHFALQKYSITAQGFIMFMTAVLGLLMLGIVYRSIELLRGKRLSEIAGELGAAYGMIIRGFKNGK